ncbi:MAG: HDIG domain-containing protein [Mediterranea sp.]|jgi:uncharacterized protein|nr:HDIG domain-containing protein [Mediterranea sp.]
MDIAGIIDTYYPGNSELKQILLTHSHLVAKKALAVADKYPEYGLDRTFLYEASMLHDIGIFLTNAPNIYCFGNKPYLCHGYLGAELLAEAGYPQHALVCERHTGAGISLEQIIKENLPLPRRSMLPVSLEEQVICFADKFFSKSHPDTERTVGKALKSISRYGEEGIIRFNKWCGMFL